MKHTQLIFFLFSILCLFSSLVFSSPVGKGPSYYGEVQYEQCDCTNNKFTKHLIEPYKKEIEQWLLQTAPPEDQQTEAGSICVDCQIKPVIDTEEEGFFSPVTNFFQGVWGWLKSPWEDTEETVSSSPHSPSYKKPKKPNFIPSLCFQMSGEMTNTKPKSESDFFTCIREHYDGSDSDNLCSETVNEPGHPKKCIALPIACEDAENPKLTCKPKIRERDNDNKANGCNRGASHTRRPCLNEEYVSLTAKAFNDVAKCLDAPLDLAFSILHHEARFLLNNESDRGALCHAQVTGNAVADFNSFVDNKPNYPSMKELLPENIKANCPEQWKHFKKANTKYNKKHERFEVKTDYDRCKLNLNPYTCFFYGLSYIKILINKTEKAVQNNYIEIAENIHSIMIFKDDEEKENTEKTRDKKLKTKKIKIFRDENTVKKIIITAGYNGGTSVPDKLFKNFMTDIKKQLSNPENQNMRIALLTTGLDISLLKNGFEQFLIEKYPSKSKNRRKQVANYINKVDGDVNTLHESIQNKYPHVFPNDVCPRWENGVFGYGMNSFEKL